MKKKTIGIIAAACLGVMAIVAWNPFGKKADSFSFDTVVVSQGDVRNLVTATGTLQAIKTVEVGTQVSGVVLKIHVDFNSAVKKGQLLAEIDKAPLLTTLASSQAQLDNAKAEVRYNKSNFERTKALYDKQMVSQYEYDQAVYNYAKAEANYKVSETNFSKAKINLEYATIYSPIDGVILNRNVDEGQTVAASFSTPTLFSIANDLTRMQVEANIDEADIGLVKMGQAVGFQVDAFPDMQFKGEVTQIRLQPLTTSNVVTYTVIIDAPNPTLQLMPGMTANINILVEEAAQVPVLAAKALRFTPEAQLFDAYVASLAKDSLNPMANANTESLVRKPDENKVWVKQGAAIFSREIEVGITDGINVEIKGGLQEGDEIILAMHSTAEGAQATSSPFMPKRPGADKKDKK